MIGLVSFGPTTMMAFTDATIVIKPSHMDGWNFQIGNSAGPVTSSAGFETGPGTPPLQNGSAEFKTGADGDSFALLRNSNYQGVPLSVLTSLSYDTYVTAHNGCVVAYLSLLVDLNDNGVFDAGDDRIFFEPCYQTGTYGTVLPDNQVIPLQNAPIGPDGSTVRTGEWQHWDALIGGWWSALDGFGGPPLTTIASYINRDAAHQNAKIVNATECLGGVRFSAGAGAPVWDDFEGNIDNFTIGVSGDNITFDFEFENLPIPECGVQPAGAVTACKFYDFNANHIKDASDLPLDGWPITISPLGNATPNVATQLTSGGCVSWSNLEVLFNPYTFTEGTPNETNWVHSTPASVAVTVAANDTTTINFGNYCTVPSGGRTIGFWGNKNGLALLTQSDFAALTALRLVNKNGTDRDFTSTLNNNKKDLESWLQKADSVNMAYMLSAQLAATKLNVLHGFVDGNAFALCYNGTINQLIAAANAALIADQQTPVGDPNRATQETLKNCLDALNNGGPVVPVTPCPRHFAQ
jgi:hypothetical protein